MRPIGTDPVDLSTSGASLKPLDAFGTSAPNVCGQSPDRRLTDITLIDVKATCLASRTFSVRCLPVDALGRRLAMKRSWRCRLGWHQWQKAFTEDNKQYVACRRCGKATDVPLIPGGM